MKRFVLLMWDLHDFTHIELAKTEAGFPRIFPRKKEALDHAKTISTTAGFNFRAIRIWIP